MFQQLDGLTVPARDCQLWRYMDFTKLVSLLDRQCLYFVRADQFDDRWEGVYPLKNLARQLRNALQLEPGRQEWADLLDQIDRRNRSATLVNCWHMSQSESSAMWRLYSKSPEAVAVCSTVGGLIDCFAGPPEVVTLGKVTYHDYNAEEILDPYPFRLSPFFYKRNSFAYEKEVRAAISWDKKTAEARGESHHPIPEHGIYVRVDLKSLIHRVVVAPGVPRWFYKLVCSVMDRLDFGDIAVERSTLDQPPPDYAHLSNFSSFGDTGIPGTQD